MSQVSNNIEKNIEEFEKKIQKQNKCLTNLGEVWSLLETLIEEVKTCRENSFAVETNLNRIVEGENIDITNKYILLKDTTAKLQEENAQLKNHIDNMEFKMIADREAVKSECAMQQLDIEEKYKYEIKILQIQIDADNKRHEERLNELYNENQIAQAAADMQCDEIETLLNSRLVDVSNKLRESQNLCRSLQMELHNMKKNLPKNQLSNTNIYGNPTEQQQKLVFNGISPKPNVFETRNESTGSCNDKYLRISSSKAPAFSHTTEKLTNNNLHKLDKPTNNTVLKSETPTNDTQVKTYNTSKYPPLGIIYTNGNDLTDDDARSIPKPIPIPPLFKGNSVRRLGRKTVVPPLKPCTKAGTNKAEPRKRKLYNPEDPLEFSN